MRKIDTTPFIKRKENDLITIQIYVVGIIFGATNNFLCEHFANLMKK